MKKLLSLLLAGALLFPLMVVVAQDVSDVEEIPAEESVVASLMPLVSSIPTVVYYYAAGIIVFVIVYMLVMKVVKRKGDTFKTDKFAEIEQKSAAEKQAMLDGVLGKHCPLHSLQAAVKDEKVVGIRQCYPYQTMKGAAKQGAKTLGKQALWSLVGVKATYHDVGKYYLILTEKNLYYIAFDKHEEVAETVAFPLTQMMHVTLRKPGTKDMVKYSVTVSNTHSLTPGGGQVLEFEYAGEKMSFVYYLQNVSFPNIDLKEHYAVFADHYDAILYLEMMFQKKLEERC